ncbi:MAG: type IV toxin-antitoxin system AbiEi family antitoxin domain-containing protein [Solirubrobacteraceae bacterium]
MSISDIYVRLTALAQKQGGHLTRSQLERAGLSAATVSRHVSTGRLIRVHQGVYAVGHLPTNPLDRAHGALLAAGPRSALAGGSAAAFWQLFKRYPSRPELISPLRRRIPGVMTRVSQTLRSRDIRRIPGAFTVTVTSPARTLLDIAPRISKGHLDRYHNELRMRHLIANEQLIDVALRNPRHPGACRLMNLAGESRGEPLRSALELDWKAFVKRHPLPRNEMNVQLAGERVDVLFMEPRPLIIELDGWDTHGTRQAYEADRERDAKILAETGIPTVRITHHGLHHRSRTQAQRIRTILGLPA